MTKEYVCPECKKKQTTVIESQEVFVSYEFDLATGNSEEVDKSGGDHASWFCPACGKELDSETIEKVEKMLGW